MTQIDSGDGESRPQTVTRHEEEVAVGRQQVDVDHVAGRRIVDDVDVAERYPRNRERLDQQRIPVVDGDSGEIELLPDGSVSIPLFEEELVVTTCVVLRERVVIRKEQVQAWQTVYATLRRERVEVDVDE
jgi:uncharacterized protein (TIGR02271 family)